jgi:ABC-type sugar transport system permease subunit
MTTRSSRQRSTSMPEYRDKITGWLLLLPALLLLIVVFAYPIGRALWLSYLPAISAQNWNLFSLDWIITLG